MALYSCNFQICIKKHIPTHKTDLSKEAGLAAEYFQQCIGITENKEKVLMGKKNDETGLLRNRKK